VRPSWLELVDSVLRPARAGLERCLAAREPLVATRALVSEERGRAIARCVAEIERLRTAVFEAQDGVVTARMTELEREWRRLARPDPDAGCMDLWARIAPPSWIDRKRWRDSEPRAQARFDAVTALAADVEGVEAAESAVLAWRLALAAFATPIGARVRWRAFEHDAGVITPLLAEPLRLARAALSVVGAETVVVERAQPLQREVHAAMLARFPERPALAQEVAHAAFVDGLWRAAAVAGRPDPVAPLRALWMTGYVLAAVDASTVTVELPPLPPLAQARRATPGTHES
jgi:hypothetical protein